MHRHCDEPQPALMCLRVLAGAICLILATTGAGVARAQERPAVGDPPAAPEERFLMDPPGIDVREIPPRPRVGSPSSDQTPVR